MLCVGLLMLLMLVAWLGFCLGYAPATSYAGFMPPAFVLRAFAICGLPRLCHACALVLALVYLMHSGSWLGSMNIV